MGRAEHLGLHGKSDGLRNGGERDVEGIALSVDLIPAMRSNAFPHHLRDPGLSALS